MKTRPNTRHDNPNGNCATNINRMMPGCLPKQETANAKYHLRKEDMEQNRHAET